MDLLPYVCVRGMDELRVYAFICAIEINCLYMLKDWNTKKLSFFGEGGGGGVWECL